MCIDCNNFVKEMLIVLRYGGGWSHEQFEHKN